MRFFNKTKTKKEQEIDKIYKIINQEHESNTKLSDTELELYSLTRLEIEEVENDIMVSWLKKKNLLYGHYITVENCYGDKKRIVVTKFKTLDNTSGLFGFNTSGGSIKTVWFTKQEILDIYEKGIIKNW